MLFATWTPKKPSVIPGFKHRGNSVKKSGQIGAVKRKRRNCSRTKTWTFSMNASAVMVYLPYYPLQPDPKMTLSCRCTRQSTRQSTRQGACITGRSTKQHYSVVSHKGCGVTKSGGSTNKLSKFSKLRLNKTAIQILHDLA